MGAINLIVSILAAGGVAASIAYLIYQHVAKRDDSVLAFQYKHVDVFAVGLKLSPSLRDDIRNAIDSIECTFDEIRQSVPNYAVEIRRVGQVSGPFVPPDRDPETVGGSIRFEDGLGIAIVIEHNAGAFVIHEVIAHLEAWYRGHKGYNYQHLDTGLKKLEARASAIYAGGSCGVASLHLQPL